MNIFGIGGGGGGGSITHKPQYIQYNMLKHKTIMEDTIIINTMTQNEQYCLISGTMTPNDEIATIQSLQDELDYKKNIVVYGKHSTDTTVDTKYNQLKNLGFTNVFIYRGGMFEWTLLQKVYGNNEFMTSGTSTEPLLWSSFDNDYKKPINTTPMTYNLLQYFY
jgi:hypothetical protein